MLGLGWGEIFMIAAVALVFVGPERLPRLLRDLGRMYGQVRRSADDLRRSFVLEADRQDAEERYQQLQKRRRKAAEARAATAEPAAPESLAEAMADAHPPPEADPPSDEVDPNADDPEAPHPVQLARRELP